MASGLEGCRSVSRWLEGHAAAECDRLRSQWWKFCAGCCRGEAAASNFYAASGQCCCRTVGSAACCSCNGAGTTACIQPGNAGARHHAEYFRRRIDTTGPERAAAHSSPSPAGRTTVVDAQIFHCRARRLHYCGPLSEWSARRNLYQDGEGRFDRQRFDGCFRHCDFTVAATWCTAQGAVREVFAPPL